MLAFPLKVSSISQKRKEKDSKNYFKKKKHFLVVFASRPFQKLQAASADRLVWRRSISFCVATTVS